MKALGSAALVVLLLALAACADAPGEPGDGGGIDHATDPDDLLVRIGFEGGFTPIEWTYTNLPTFSLYGDGTLIVPGAQIEIYPPPALPAISARTIDEPGIQAILDEALTATSDVPDDLDDLGAMGIADAPTTVITVSADGMNRTIRTYALGELMERPEGMPERQYRARLRLQELVARLGTLDAWLPAGSLGPEATYRGSSARIFVAEYRAIDDPPQEAVAWPLERDLASFGEPADDSDLYRCATVDGEDWSAVRAVAARANQLTRWQDGELEFRVLFRPLLPGESGC
jgi:hypothetical protein